MSLRFKTPEEAAAWLKDAAAARARKTPDEKRAAWYGDARDRIEARGERVTSDSLRSELKASSTAGREQLVFEGEARDQDVIAAVAVAGFNAQIASGLQGIIDAANSDKNYARESLPHYDRIESAATSAQYALESTLPWYMRKRRAEVWILFGVMLAGALVAGYVWSHW